MIYRKILKINLKKISEGTIHGILANKLSESLNQNIYFVPRIYADELVRNEPSYLKDLSKILNPDINVFYSGKYVVSKILTNYRKISKVLNNKIIFGIIITQMIIALDVCL